MNKLQILIAQYHETEEQIKPLLESIALQQNINLKEDIEVFIGNDGSDTKLSVDFLKQFPYRIQYHFFEHGGLAATRCKLQRLATADYIMFCDADDKFISTIAISIILESLKAQPCDALICDFFEEHHNPTIYIPHTDDPIFVHGKIYNRQFLIDNEIEWNPNLLHEHQDSSFNVLARTLAKKTCVCKVPIYMWCDNPSSVSRKDGKYHTPNTWYAMLESYDSIIADLLKRGMGEHAKYYSVWALYATYFEMAHDVWKEDIPEQKLKTYKALRAFYDKHKLLIKNCSDDKIPEIEKRTKELAEKKGKLNDMPPFLEWLEAILKIF